MSGNDETRRRVMRLLGAGAGLGVATPLAASADEDGERDVQESDDAAVESGAGLVTVSSPDDFETTVERIEQGIEGREIELVMKLDHAGNAESADLSLPPTTLLVFGNPEAGTPLMQAKRSVAIDLPQKLLVWEEESEVFVTYNDPQYLAARHDIDGMGERLEGIESLLSKLATGERTDDGC